MEQKTYNIRFEGIDLVEKILYRSNITESDKFNFEVKTQAIADPVKQTFAILVLVDIKKESTIDLVGRLLVGLRYKFEYFETSFSNDEEGRLVVPPELDNLLKSISISTVRGIMFSEFRGTQIHQAILPIIMTDTLVPTEDDIIKGKRQTIL